MDQSKFDTNYATVKAIMEVQRRRGVVQEDGFESYMVGYLMGFIAHLMVESPSVKRKVQDRLAFHLATYGK
jgi:hypothetical protein